MNMETVRSWGLGWLIALLVLVVCVVLLVIGKALDTTTVLVMIAALALARLV